MDCNDHQTPADVWAQVSSEFNFLVSWYFGPSKPQKIISVLTGCKEANLYLPSMKVLSLGKFNSIDKKKKSEFELTCRESSCSSVYVHFHSWIWVTFELICHFGKLQLHISSSHFWCPEAPLVRRISLNVGQIQALGLDCISLRSASGHQNYFIKSWK